MAEKFGGSALSIGEFGKLVGATRSQLIYYDHKGCFCPASRIESGQQAPNRRYKADQVFQYRMLMVLQQLGFSLEEAGNYLNNNPEWRTSFLHHQHDQLTREITRLQAMQESLVISQILEETAGDSNPEHPVFFTLDKSRRCLYHAFEKPLLRGTDEFIHTFVHQLALLRDNVDVLPTPVALTFSVDAMPDGRFPVTGLLSLYRQGINTSQSNYILSKGRYLMYRLSGPLGGVSGAMMKARRYLWEHSLKRCSSVFACNIGVRDVEDTAAYSEMVIYRVCDGETPAGVKPTLPGIE